MLLARINRTEPERVLIIVKAGEALVEGRPVCYHFDGTNGGKDAFLANAATDATMVIGLADEAIASGAYGRVLVYGLKTNAQVLISGSHAAVDCGAILKVVSGGGASNGGLSLSIGVGAATNVQPNFVLAHSASVTSASTEQALGVYVRCL